MGKSDSFRNETQITKDTKDYEGFTSFTVEGRDYSGANKDKRTFVLICRHIVMVTYLLCLMMERGRNILTLLHILWEGNRCGIAIADAGSSPSAVLHLDPQRVWHKQGPGE
jgi:hypothetical protein